jgi:acetyl-CoA hydrolase
MEDIDWTAHLPPPRGPRPARRVSADEAVRAIPEGARIFIEAAAMTPVPLVQTLSDAAATGRWNHLEVVTAYLMTRLPIFQQAGSPFRFVTLQASPAFKYLWAGGSVAVLPCRYSDLAGLCRQDGPMPCDVALLQVSAPGPEGRVSLGLSVGANVDVALSAPLVIAQVNRQVPYTFGAGELTLDKFDYLVEIDGPLLEARPGETADEVGLAIARRAAGFVPDGATLQFGIGALPDAILAALGNRRGFRVHSGMISDACLDLYEAGVIEGPMVAAEVVSTPRMMRWVDRNPTVLMAPASYSHGAGALAGQPRFTALNSTVEVALDGACNSEMVGGEIISGPGGAPDYAFGASVSSGGRSIMALRSTAGRGAVSRIVPSIEPPKPVTLPAYLADVVVTEHGAAEVRGLPLAERARALAAIADPAHRQALLSGL